MNNPEIQLPVSLRDYFAAKVAQGLSANSAWLSNAASAGDAVKMVATASYELADAMLAEREKP